MSNANRTPRQYFAAAHRAIASAASAAGAIEWEEMPSLARRVQSGPRDPLSAAENESAWGDTAWGHLDTVASSLPFVEEVRGLETREVREPDVFRHFFGPNAE